MNAYYIYALYMYYVYKHTYVHIEKHLKIFIIIKRLNLKNKKQKK